MKSDLIGKPEQRKKRHYPYLGITRHGLVVLFYSPGHGTVVHTPDEKFIGLHSININNTGKPGSWDEEKFEPLRGTIVLKN